MLFVRAGAYLEATGPSGEPGPFELPLLRLLRARGPVMQDFCVILALAGCRGMGVAKNWGA